jgi:hypothetical protein
MTPSTTLNSQMFMGGALTDQALSMALTAASEATRFDMAIGRRVFWNGSDYFYEPAHHGHRQRNGLASRRSRRCWKCRRWEDNDQDAHALDMAACWNRDLLDADGSFDREAARRFFEFALETDRPWGLRRRRSGPGGSFSRKDPVELPTLEGLTDELLKTGYWLKIGERFRLADAEDLLAYWQWFDAEERRREQVRRISYIRRHRILARDGERCVLCGSTEELVVDHVVPVASGGRADDVNLRTLCRRCNGARNFPQAPRATYFTATKVASVEAE